MMMDFIKNTEVGRIKKYFYHIQIIGFSIILKQVCFS